MKQTQGKEKGQKKKEATRPLEESKCYNKSTARNCGRPEMQKKDQVQYQKKGSEKRKLLRNLSVHVGVLSMVASGDTAVGTDDEIVVVCNHLQRGRAAQQNCASRFRDVAMHEWDHKIVHVGHDKNPLEFNEEHLLYALCDTG